MNPYWLDKARRNQKHPFLNKRKERLNSNQFQRFYRYQAEVSSLRIVIDGS